MTVLSLKICPVLFLLPALTVGAEHVKGLVGGRVTLPCTYSVTGGATSTCWGRGHCPKSKCLDAILWTDSDGKKVIWNHTERYRLLGNITQGDVSLTITQLTLSDSGTYCCRVEIPGLFNDLKIEIQVRVNDNDIGKTVNSTPAISTTSEVPHSSASFTEPSLNPAKASTQLSITDIQTASPVNINSYYFPHVIVCVVLLLFLFLCLAGFLYKYKYYEKLKTKVLSTAQASNRDM
ncbi:hepatitis A virus cellular receptor 1 homolog isoform X2 [Xenopus laevis]|uniref:Hepatitis A virus cellular receptor 1 homolog isoform X2 n=1 Tax=Xenopus laevis TaxID=8355 RepID=A0A8J1MKG9_XENLA|nr:hepatitis A virus cellular receptor 1 homolog isoform X2 [Xenopus laevis]